MALLQGAQQGTYVLRCLRVHVLEYFLETTTSTPQHHHSLTPCCYLKVNRKDKGIPLEKQYILKPRGIWPSAGGNLRRSWSVVPDVWHLLTVHICGCFYFCGNLGPLSKAIYHQLDF
jgi:hypothetical protein